MTSTENLRGLAEIADLLQISKQTLLFWEKEGLIRFDRNPENNYRILTSEVLWAIDEVSYYRSMGVSINRIREIFHKSLYELDANLDDIDQGLEDQIKALQYTRGRIKFHRQCIMEAADLGQNPYQDGEPGFDRIVLYLRNKKSHWYRNIEQPQRFTLVIHPENPSNILEGVIDAPITADDTVLWQKDRQQIRWKVLLLRFEEFNQNRDNVQEHLQTLKQLGYKTGVIVAQYLCKSFDHDTRWVNYKGWVEILDEP